VPSLARSERQRLCDTALVVGPDAPTLSGEWNVRDLLAHLVVRDSDPVGGPGIVLPPLAFLTERRMHNVAQADFAHLVERVRRPAVWAPARLPGLDKALNTLEFFVHHEDIRRAQPGWTARTLPETDEQTLWSYLEVVGRGLARPAGVPVRLEWASRTATLRRGEGAVVLRGLPSELALVLQGRARVADVAYDGPARSVAKLRGADLGV